MQNPDRVTYFAATDSRGQRTPFGIKAKDRPRHMYVIGKTGMGKSTLLENMAIQDIQNGEGMAFIDPHGSAVEALLEYIPQHRINDVVYFAPFDMEHPVAFNVMEDVGYDKRHLVTSGLMATFRKIWQDAWSARMEYILTNTMLALLEYPGATLLDVNRMYTDKNFRAKVVENIKDPVVKDFWVKEFAGYTDRFTQEATPAIQNKVGQFTSNPLIRNIIGQPDSSFDIRELMDSRKILLVNLSKGLVGDVNMRLLGSMITTRIFLAAMSRADLPPQELKNAPPFYFYVDEFQNFANETFAEILSEARKYNLNLIMAHQYVEQMEDEVKAAVFGNVGTTVAYRVGPFDAEALETVFSPEFTKEDLVNLGQYQMYLSLMIDGVGSRPFSAVGIPPIEPPQLNLKQQVIEASRKQYASPRAPVEKRIFDELLAADQAAPPKLSMAKMTKKPALGAGKPGSGRGVEKRPSDGRAPEKPREHGNRKGEGRAHALRQENARSEHSKRRDGNDDIPAEKTRAVAQPIQPAPPQEGKSLQDLRSILKDMTQTAEAARESAKPKRDAAPLKQALEKAASNTVKNVSQSASQGSKPFEVPEDTLRALFRDQ